MLKRWDAESQFVMYEAGDGEYVKWKDLLPLLREARELAQMIYGTAEDHARAQRFLDATKGVEG